MAFAVPADSYDRFMGRYSSLLAPAFADFARVEPGQHVLDVGSGPGALTAELLRRGAQVSAADPSESFVAAIAERFPGIDARLAPAERLPFEDGAFDAALAQLVVHFMQDPVAGIGEMARVTRPGGTVAACVWDHGADRTPLTPFWSAVRRLGLGVRREHFLPGVRAGHLVELFTSAGLADVEGGEIAASVEHATFEEWWEPFTLGVAPAGEFYSRLRAAEAEALREEARAGLGPPPIRIEAVAWVARGYNSRRVAA